ncbi:E3 ubiquitin-protein ligase MIB2-like [Amphiura filiformis]|uniref:E3 ubiquitin-protein ligase MIB2-like n=1 Tax=Amphiura filiformis TaxID=82378 RepID=UPI003B224FC6
MFYGVRVVRGPDWEWGDQDDGEGHLGTVVPPRTQDVNKTDVIWIRWDSGKLANYRAGKRGKHDLRLYDNAQIGVKHLTIGCDECQKNGIEGLRWKCVRCRNYDLCNSCYMDDKHDVTHEFLRFEMPNGPGMEMPPRQMSEKVQLLGIVAGARVKRGPDWKWEDQDGGKGKIGIVTEIGNWRGRTFRSSVQVQWENEQSNIYRFGYVGKIDVKCVEAESPGMYYRDHLPLLDMESTMNRVAEGDEMKVKELDVDKFKLLQAQRCGWQDGMEQTLGKVGKVVAVDTDGDIKVEIDGKAWFYNPKCLIPEETTKNEDNGEEDIENLLDLLLLKGVLEGGLGDALGQHPELLLAAAAKGKVDLTKQLLQGRDVQVNHQSPDASMLTALQAASHEGHLEIVKLLVQAGADLELEDKDGDRALSFSVIGDKPAITKYLLDKGADPNASNDKGLTCTHLAVLKSHVACLRHILARRLPVDVNHPDNLANTPVFLAIDTNNNEIIDMMFQHGMTNFSVMNGKGFNALHHAALKGNVHATRRILEKSRALANAKKPDGFTALHIAAVNDHYEVIKVLIDVGHCDLAVRDNDQMTALHIAAMQQNHPSIQLLVNRGADINAQDKDGDTCLHILLMKQNINELLQHTSLGRDLLTLEGGKTDKGETAETAIFLLRKGADVTKKNNRGKTIIDMVGDQRALQGQRELLQELANIVRQAPNNQAAARRDTGACVIS